MMDVGSFLQFKVHISNYGWLGYIWCKYLVTIWKIQSKWVIFPVLLSVNFAKVAPHFGWFLQWNFYGGRHFVGYFGWFLHCDYVTSHSFESMRVKFFFKKMDKLLFHFPKTCFHFQNGFQNELSFPKCGSFLKYAFIFKMWKVSWVLFSLFRKTQL